jgi:hypothetical protein
MSVQAGLLHARPRSFGISRNLQEVFDTLDTLDIAFDASYVATGDNPADPVSRGKTWVWRVGRSTGDMGQGR